MRMCCEMSPLHLISTWAFTVCVIWTTAIGDQTPVFVTPNTLTASETKTPTTIQPSTDSRPTDISSPDGHTSNSIPTDRYERLGRSTQRVLETVTVTTIAGTIKTSAVMTTVVTSATVPPKGSSTQPHIPHTVISPVATNPMATTPAASRAPKKPPCCPQPTRMPTLPPHQFIGDEGDYDDESEEEEEVTEEEEEGGKLMKENLCDFNPCLHLQRPCPEVREAKGQSCRCPGLTPTSVTPDPVVALEVWGVWPEAVRVRWCAPYSAVSKFGVWALRENGSVFSNGSVSAWSRQASVFGLKAGRRYGVCVSALNGAGTSHTRCVPVSTPVGVETVVLYVLTGLCVALGMALVVMCVFLHRIWKMQNTHSLIEPRAQTLYNPRLTSLVSITNPAYTHTDEHTVPPSARYTQRDQLKLSTNVHN